MVTLNDLSPGVRQATREELATMPRREARFLPEPDPAERTYLVVSVDDHLCEPPDTFAGRLPRRFADRAPRVVDTSNGGQAWLYDGRLIPNVGLNAVAGRAPEEVTWEPTRFDEMRRGAWDPDARVRDMDLDGVYASVNFPSQFAGFGGGRLQTIVDDLDLALATLRAYNAWHLEVWAGSHPDRLIPTQLAWLHDPEVAAADIRANARAGFKALTFPEAPHRLGFPSIYSDHWEPIVQACAETETVLCLHTGSGGSLPTTDTPGASMNVVAAIFMMSAMTTAVDWLFSGYPARHPGLKICLSEGGIGWVPGLLDRLEAKRGHRPLDWPWDDLDPVEVLARNFWYCFLEDPTTIRVRDRIGRDRIMFEVDYPHGDSKWPNSQELLREQLHDVSADDAALLTWRNAATLFRHPVPASVQDDPTTF